VFVSGVRTGLDAANVRRAFRRIAKAAGLEASQWTPRELRHSFVSLLSDDGIRLEDIAKLCGHAGIRVTEAVYRHQLRPFCSPARWPWTAFSARERSLRRRRHRKGRRQKEEPPEGA
jgi:integrase